MTHPRDIAVPKIRAESFGECMIILLVVISFMTNNWIGCVDHFVAGYFLSCTFCLFSRWGIVFTSQVVLEPSLNFVLE